MGEGTVSEIDNTIQAALLDELEQLRACREIVEQLALPLALDASGRSYCSLCHTYSQQPGEQHMSGCVVLQARLALDRRQSDGSVIVR